MYITGKVIVIDNTKEKNDVFFCKICSYPLVTKRDFDAQKEYFCCDECFLSFAQARKENWKSGWRPPKSKIQEYLKVRKRVSERIINIAGD